MTLPPFELERWFEQHEFEADHVLGASDVAGWNLRDLLALADAEIWPLWDQLHLGYTHARGRPELRAEIAGLYDGLTADDVLVFSGAEEALYTLSRALMGPGTHAVVVTPAYQSLVTLPRACGADVTELPLRLDNDWEFRASDLKAALSPRTSMVVWNFPHNPTGSLPDQTVFEEAVRLVEDANCRLISDEVYRYLEYDELDRLPGAASLSPRAISVGVMSKSFGLAGLRIGWIATRDRDAIEACLRYKDYLTICPSAPSEVMAIIALRARGRVLLRSRQMVEVNLEIAEEFFASYGDTFDWVAPRAGTVTFPRLNVDIPIQTFAEELLREQGVLIAPGPMFGAKGNHFRLGLGRPDMEQAMVKLDRFCKQWLTRY